MSLPHFGALKVAMWAFGVTAAAIVTLDPTVKGGLIAAIPGAIAAILGYYNNKSIKEMKINVDGNLKRLLDEKQEQATVLTQKSEELSHAQGRREGVESQKEKEK